MTFLFRPAALAVLLFLGAAASAQQPPVDGPAPRPPAASANVAPPPPPDGPGARQAQAAAPAASVVTGRLQRWLVNPAGDVDGLLLADGTQVAFPPHLSAEATRLLQPGDNVRVEGWGTPGAQVLRASSLVATASGRRLDDTPPAFGAAPPQPRDPGALVAMSGGGRVARLLRTSRGDVNGALLDNGTIVRFPPHVGAALAPTIQPGATIHATGWGSRGAQGSAFEATAIGPTPADMREIFAGPGREPGGPRGARGPGTAGGPVRPPLAPTGS